ncbi:uncharacterized protein SOCE26_064790 [Sorangium cellulosum]|uniref:Secreted protein n=1 Tax=Sorangium cellulosum TaxID=56 RepID=A0A2L0F0D3_SORCE|nr:hypothetical protein [Sorangium cellulosum]AUX45000.1 uncharacterized protein SOCE26_064790 [Sorangium cellulosum]
MRRRRGAAAAGIWFGAGLCALWLAGPAAGCGGNVAVDRPPAEEEPAEEVPAGEACAGTSDRVDIRLQLPDGTVHGCMPETGASLDPGITQFVRRGTVAVHQDDLFFIDECPPSMADACVASATVLRVSGPGLAPRLPLGTIVDVALRVDSDEEGCGAQLMITNVPEWEGRKSAGGTAPTLLLAAADGLINELSGSPFAVAVSPECMIDPEDPARGSVFALQFFDVANPADQGIKVRQGEWAEWRPGSSTIEPTWRIRNVRSFIGEPSQFGRSWAYWVEPALDD